GHGPRLRGGGLAGLPVIGWAGRRDRRAEGLVLPGVLRWRVPRSGGGRRALQVRARDPVTAPAGGGSGEEAYRLAGVDLGAGHRAVELIRAVAAGAVRPEVMGGVGGFGGLISPGDGRMLVAATDGVGTKLEVARLAGK